MDALFLKIKTLRDLNDTTTKGYLSSLLRLQKKMGALPKDEIDNQELNKFFENWFNILDFIKLNFKKPYQLNLLNCMIVSMEAHLHEHEEPSPTIKNGLGSMRVYQMEIKKELDLTKYAEKKSETEELNWVPYKELHNVIKITNKRVNKILQIGRPITLKEGKDIMLWIVANLYVGSKENPPLRLDYNNMIILNEKDYLEKKVEGQNYLVIVSSRTKYFVLGEYKTFKKYGTKSIKLSPVINKVINRWEQIKGNMIDNVKIHNNYLLFNNKAEPLSESLMSSYIADAFKSTGKHITVNLIRHIFITDVVAGLPLIERKIISEKMCHNLEMQQVYNKVD
tara:strand:+ start:860 stop:1873 length:1014 start_codon:yes stop_codon:yes gene_type:complete